MVSNNTDFNFYNVVLVVHFSGYIYFPLIRGIAVRDVQLLLLMEMHECYILMKTADIQLPLCCHGYTAAGPFCSKTTTPRCQYLS